MGDVYNGFMQSILGFSIVMWCCSVFWGLCHPSGLIIGLLLVWTPFTFSRFACFPWLDGWLEWPVHKCQVACQYRRRVKCDKCVGGMPCQLWRFVVLWCCVVRFGEATNPGPLTGDTWRCGIFNPSGLSNKVDYLAQVPGDIWFGSETHLTRAGICRLRNGLRLQKSAYTHIVTGAPCSARVSDEAGSYSGVIALSRFPARPLPHSFDPDLFATARIMVCGIAVRDCWIQAGVMYGYPQSLQHKHRTYRAECLLDELVNRVVLQGVGPRLVCGDFNHSSEALVQVQRMRQLGFREIQEVALASWGQTPQETSLGTTIIDQIWLSPELQGLLQSVTVAWDHWSSHATVEASFKHVSSELDRFVWYRPGPVEWPETWDCFCQVEWSSPSIAYAVWWYQVENGVAPYLPASQSHNPKWRGRGQTLQSKRVRPFVAPCKLGRPGDDQPGFYGQSLQHVRWFRQLRRLHSLERLLARECLSIEQYSKALELWKAIKCATGFGEGFGAWWIQHYPEHFGHFLPIGLPSFSQLQVMVQEFRKQVRSLEVRLGAARLSEAKQRRLTDASLAFRDCMRDPPDPVGTMVLSAEMHVAELCPDDVSIVVTQPVVLRDGLPLVGAGRRFEVIMSDTDQIWLDSIEGLSVGDVLRQEKVISSDEALLNEFEAVWKPRWQKLSHVVPDQWNQISSFCARVFQPLQWNFAPWTLASFRSALAAKKRRSAIGPDGVSRDDLLALPDSALTPAITLFQHLEEGGEWPCQLTQGFVRCLDKRKGDGGVDSFRPIVNYPVLTRLWSSVRAREALQTVAPFLPEGLRGGVPGQQAKSIWYQLAQTVELAHFEGSSVQGVAVDIQRAFNNLPREPIWMAVLALGLPLQVLRPWTSFVISQARRFAIRSSVGGPISSNVGYPEGCAWSVFAMNVADWMLSEWLNSMVTSPHRVYTFVDDWSVIYLDPAAFQMVWDALVSFVRAMDLALDFAKSCCWAALGADRRSLKQAPVQMVLSTRDLGAHQNFSLRSGNRTVLDRLDSLQELWPKLRRCLSPYAIKARLLVQMAWPRALHGISIVNLGVHRYTLLRAGALKGLRSNRIGANPYLHLMTHGVQADPEGWAILQTFREFREVGNQEQMQTLLDFCSRGLWIPPNGPCAILVNRACRLGWTLEPGGVFHDVFGRCDIYGMAWSTLVARVQWSWPRVVAAAVSHRPSFSGIQFADVSEVKLVLSRLGDADRTLYRCCLDGTLYQDITKSKEQRGSASKCVFCNAVDSPYHRLWICPHFASCRSGCQFLELMPSVAPCLASHGWPLIPPQWYALCDWYCSVPEPPSVFDWPPLVSGKVVHVFVDGTAAFPSEAKLRYAAWGVTVALGAASLDHQILTCGHVQGLIQTSYRAELQAMVVALRAIAGEQLQAVIWSDCSSVVNRTRRLLATGKVKANSAHSDLWQQVALLVEGGKLDGVRIQKVTSHCSNPVDGVEQWAFWHNKLVDAAVGHYNCLRPPEFWERWGQLRDALFFNREVHSEVVAVMLRVAHFSALRQPATTEPEGNVAIVEPRPRALQRWVLDPTVGRKYRLENVQQVHSWWNRIGATALGTSNVLQWVAGIQLYVDYFLTTGWNGPVSPHHSRWYLGNGDVPADIDVHLASKVTAFIRLLRAYWKSNDFTVPAKVKRCWGFSIGYWTLCFRLPWDIQRLRRADDKLFHLLQRQIARPCELRAFTTV